MKAFVVLLVLLPGIAAAEELYPPLPGVEYYCTDGSGERVEIGRVSCLTASCQTWMARCEMGVNNRLAMWRKLRDGCPGASAEGALGRLKRLQQTL